jgi:O-antigen biosynthesis protein
MSKYPFIILYRYNKYNQIDDYIDNNKANYDCTFINIKCNQQEILKLFNENYHILLTVGDSDNTEYNFINNIIPDRFKNKWIHKTVDELKNTVQLNTLFNDNFIYNVIQPRTKTRPTFSIFTTCFNSYEFIKIAYESIKNQTLIDWEWVILDDSPKDTHFYYLRKIFQDEYKVRLYKRQQNSGNIGNVKNEAISLCRGKYILEMDHDDIILTTCLMDAATIFNEDDEVGFIYADTIPLYRNNNPLSYGKVIAKGYGSEYKFFYKDKWINSYLTPNINNITLSHLVCCPNHPRIWRRDTLNKLENYSEYLPICDDYEIILRTCLNCKVVKINKPLYIQFTNENGNNFSNIRNIEINRIGPNYIAPIFYHVYKVHEECKKLNCYENEQYINSNDPIWKRDNYEHKKLNKIINNDITHQVCIINHNIYDNDIRTKYYDNELYELYFLTNIFTDKECEQILTELNYFKVKFISHTDCTDNQLINFFNYLLANDNCDTIFINNKSKDLLDNSPASEKY